MSQFEKVAFQARKYLRSMAVGEQRTLSQLLCKRSDIRNAAAQLKKLGEGTWTTSIAKKSGQTNITRIA